MRGREEAAERLFKTVLESPPSPGATAANCSWQSPSNEFCDSPCHRGLLSLCIKTAAISKFNNRPINSRKCVDP